MIQQNRQTLDTVLFTCCPVPELDLQSAARLDIVRKNYVRLYLYRSSLSLWPCSKLLQRVRCGARGAAGNDTVSGRFLGMTLFIVPYIHDLVYSSVTWWKRQFTEEDDTKFNWRGRWFPPRRSDGPRAGGGLTELELECTCDLTVTSVCVTQSLFCVQSNTDVASVGGRWAVTGACALVVTAATAHWALRPGWPAGPGTIYCNAQTSKVVLMVRIWWWRCALLKMSCWFLLNTHFRV